LEATGENDEEERDIRRRITEGIKKVMERKDRTNLISNTPPQRFHRGGLERRVKCINRTGLCILK